MTLTTDDTATTTMKAVVLQNGNLTLSDLPIPQPGPGEALVRVLATGICGSDLHCRAHTGELLDATEMATGTALFEADAQIVMGHEFCAEVVSYGPSSKASLPPGSRVASPGLLLRDPLRLIGYAGPDIPGGYAQYMLLSEDLMFPVPDNLSDEVAALAEPMTVALHAVNRGNVGADDVPLVIGCGPVGLAVIAVLKMRGYGPIVAADLSPTRRALATTLGADIVVDPRVTSPYDAWREAARTDDPARLAPPNLMIPGDFRPQVIFECVGVPDLMAQVFAGAIGSAKVVVAGVCMQPDTFHPTVASIKEIDLVYAFAFSPEEYGEVLEHLASGALQVAPLITSTITLDDVADAFDRLADPERDAKIVVRPNGSATLTGVPR
ncbi:zinc-binding dehydrogenase [Gordonia sp. TBRC 11910]|uniref:Zinc-binding dehydrogenase n=1 Tax=Gordonia asplenii TaxID=2725283 RepID=A0A848L2I7_9ACTN|nr:zinc-binding dehydrogenase [Gordonia asplenii]NMO02751.1 zinc-binding dehydrogenase [Gordonia asplenii]